MLRARKQLSILVLKELRILLRDRQSLFLLFLMPALFVLLLSLALSQVYREKVGRPLPVLLELQEQGEFAKRVRDLLDSGGELELLDRELPGARSTRAHILIPRGFSAEMEAVIDSEGTAPFREHPIEWEADPMLDASDRRLLETTLVLAAMEALFDGLIAEDDSYSGLPAQELLERRRDRRFVIESSAGGGRTIVPTPLQQTVPGWSLFAMFFIVVPLSDSWMRDRQRGTLRRLMSYPLSRGAIVSGKLLPYLLINVTQFVTMLCIGRWLVPLFSEQSLQLGSHPSHLLLVTVVAALAATGFGMLIASLARTTAQASAVGATSVVVMALLGGVMVPTFLMPRLMQKFALLSPLHWGLEAYHDVLLREAELSAILPRVAVLLLFATVCFTVAVRRAGHWLGPDGASR